MLLRPDDFVGDGWRDSWLAAVADSVGLETSPGATETAVSTVSSASNTGVSALAESVMETPVSTESSASNSGLATLAEPATS